MFCIIYFIQMSVKINDKMSDHWQRLGAFSRFCTSVVWSMGPRTNSPPRPSGERALVHCLPPVSRKLLWSHFPPWNIAKCHWMGMDDPSEIAHVCDGPWPLWSISAQVASGLLFASSGTRMTGLFFQVFFDLTVMLQGFSTTREGQA